MALSATLHAQELPLGRNSQRPLPKLPNVSGSLTLTAESDPDTGLNAFYFEGKQMAPVIHVRPGGTLEVTYVN